MRRSGNAMSLGRLSRRHRLAYAWTRATPFGGLKAAPESWSDSSGGRRRRYSEWHPNRALARGLAPRRDKEHPLQRRRPPRNLTGDRRDLLARRPGRSCCEQTRFVRAIPRPSQTKLKTRG